MSAASSPDPGAAPGEPAPTEPAAGAAGAPDWRTPEGKPSLGAADAAPLGLFEGYGVEIEAMIVDRETLSVAPLADELLRSFAGGHQAEVPLDGLALSNELPLHVLELKTDGPAPALAGLADRFQAAARRALEALEPLGARVMPGGMHPWMDPEADLRLWPHEYDEVYRTFDRIFDCSGHGWANLQSTHLNLPFADDAEFGRLHRAVRLVLPLLPALAAGSPVRDGAVGTHLDERLRAYRHNARRVPSVTGAVVPEPAYTRAAYEEEVLARIYRDLAPLDPEGALRHEWVNARGAIARFDRGSIEVRLLDAQESPRADLAVVAATAAVVRFLVEDRLPGGSPGEDPPTEALAALLERVEREGPDASLGAGSYAARLGLSGGAGAVPTARDAWRHLLATAAPPEGGWGEWGEALDLILERGPLARRLLEALGDPEPGARPERARLREVYGRLCDCFDGGALFRP